MAWRPIDRYLETFRNQMGTDPTGIRVKVGALLEDQKTRLRPADRLRLLGLMVATNRKLGAFEDADLAAAAGMTLKTSSPVALADFLLQVGTLRLQQERAEEALPLIERAGNLMARELEKPLPQAKESHRRRRWIEATRAAAHVLRGEVFYYRPALGTLEEAFADALTALRMTSNLVKASSHTRRVHLAAVTLLSALVMQLESPAKIRETIRLLEDAEQTFIYRCRLPASHIHRIQLKWCRATALARLGNYERAETLLRDVVERLIATGHHADGSRALNALIWVVKQSRTPDRAAYMREKYGACL